MGERQFAQCARAWPLWDKMVDGDGCDQVKSPFSCDVDHNLYGHFMARRRGGKGDPSFRVPLLICRSFLLQNGKSRLVLIRVYFGEMATKEGHVSI